MYDDADDVDEEEGFAGDVDVPVTGLMHATGLNDIDDDEMGDVGDGGSQDDAGGGGGHGPGAAGNNNEGPGGGASAALLFQQYTDSIGGLGH